MSGGAVSLTDEFMALKLGAKADAGEELTREELEFVGRWLERVEDDVVKALNPTMRIGGSFE
jgi:hypothetical protein